MDMKILDEVRIKVSDIVGADDFEKAHLENVEKSIVILAKLRNLDIETALLIAWLHDISRIRNGFGGKKHTKDGKREATKILRDLSLDKKTINRVRQAIGNHRRKDRIDDLYSELIKDADCLAHEMEFGKNIKAVEKIRCKTAFNKACMLVECEKDNSAYALIKEWKQLKVMLKSAASGKADAKLVHETRIEIRKIRAVLKTIKNESAKALETDLKEIFEKYSDLRECHVLRLHVIKIGKLEWLEKRLGKKHEAMLTTLKKDLEALTKAKKLLELEEKIFEVSRPTNMEIDRTKHIMKMYRDSVNAAEIDDMESLHRMRIKGKTLKYLLELGIYTIDDDCLKLIKEMHGEIGRLHDTQVNRGLLNRASIVGKDALNSKDVERTKRYFDEIEKQTIHTIENLLFYLKLRLRTL